MQRLFLAIMFFATIPTTTTFANRAIVPQDVLTDDEIDTITQEKNFFFRHHLDPGQPVWNHLERKYSAHYLSPRDQYYSFIDILHKTLSDGFPIRYKIQELYRARLNRHVALGRLLPRFNLTVGEGSNPINPANAFLNLFGFLMPSNWFSLIQAQKADSATRFLFLKAILDQYYLAELTYLDIHQLIQDFEIRNFYFIHLQILNDYLNKIDHNNTVVAGSFGALGTDMALNRSSIQLRFDDLADVMALKTDREGKFAADHLNISNFPNFPNIVIDLEDLVSPYNNKEDFIIEVLKRSVELKSVEELYHFAKLGVGVTAFGNIFEAKDSPTDNYLRIGINLGYDTLPRILTSVSTAKTARIDVESQFIQMIENARRAFDVSINAIGVYAEAHRAVILNQQSFYSHLQKILEENANVDGVIVRDFSNLIQSELALNNALHGALKAFALMRRLLVTEEKYILQFLPPSDEIRRIQRFFLANFPEYSPQGSHLDGMLRHLHKTKDLRKFLNGDYINVDEQADKFDNSYIKEIIAENIAILLNKIPFHRKKKKFFQVLEQYIDDNQIFLTDTERHRLNKKLGHKESHTKNQVTYSSFKNSPHLYLGSVDDFETSFSL